MKVDPLLILSPADKFIMPGLAVKVVPVFIVSAPMFIPVPVGAGRVKLAPVLKEVENPPVRLKVVYPLKSAFIPVILLIPGDTNPLNPLSTEVEVKATLVRSGSIVNVPDPVNVPFMFKVPFVPKLIVGEDPIGNVQSLPTVNVKLLVKDLLIVTLLSSLLPHAKVVLPVPLKVIEPLL